MTILVVGASGATGRLLVEQLLSRGHRVKIIVRTPNRLPEEIRAHAHLTVIRASLLELGDAAILEYAGNCDAVASCLGHNLSFKGVFGSPRCLVTEAVRRICNALKKKKPEKPIKFVLMNTAGNRNRDLQEPVSFAQKIIVGIIRILIPPHADNEQAADYLRTRIGQHDDAIEWVVIRPDTLNDEGTVSDYDVHPSPVRSAIFDPGTTSRINTAHFMADLITDQDLWDAWKGRMPVIYNKTSH